MNYGESDDDLDELPARPRQVIPAADRELLELAGRALGAVRVEEVEGENWVNLHFADGSVAYAWNPLVHRDDTFEMAVRLRISIEWEPGDFVSVGGAWAEPAGNDEPATVCRAITRAAAEIGKAIALPEG